MKALTIGEWRAGKTPTYRGASSIGTNPRDPESPVYFTVQHPAFPDDPNKRLVVAMSPTEAEQLATQLKFHANNYKNWHQGKEK